MINLTVSFCISLPPYPYPSSLSGLASKDRVDKPNKEVWKLACVRPRPRLRAISLHEILLKNSYRHTHMDPCLHILRRHDQALQLWMEGNLDHNTLTGDGVQEEGN